MFPDLSDLGKIHKRTVDVVTATIRPSGHKDEDDDTALTEGLLCANY